MAKYVFSLSRGLTLDTAMDKFDKVPEWERSCLPEALRKPFVMDVLAFIKNDAEVCIDPRNGNVTIDQLRLYTYKKKYTKKEKNTRELFVKQFVKHAPEPVKTLAGDITKNIDWNDDHSFRRGMEDIVIIYDAYAMFDPDNFPAYGELYRHNSSYSITQSGLRESLDMDFDPSIKAYYYDRAFLNQHMDKVHELYSQLVENSDKPKRDYGFQLAFHSMLSEEFNKRYGSER